MSTVLAGSRNLWWSLAVVEAHAVPPIGKWKTLVEGTLDFINGSWGRPAVDVAPVSLTPDGMMP